MSSQEPPPGPTAEPPSDVGGDPGEPSATNGDATAAAAETGEPSATDGDATAAAAETIEPPATGGDATAAAAEAGESPATDGTAAAGAGPAVFEPSAPAAPEPRFIPWVTIVLATANIGIWLLSLATGAGLFEPTPQWLFEHGGNMGVDTLDGQEWRLFTAMFLHAGLEHIAMNMVGLIGGGRLVERVFGRLGFAAIYLIAGLAGSIASALRPGVVSVGASGAIFGVLGALGAMYLVRRDRMGQTVAKEASGLLVFVGYNLLIGFRLEGVDMYAHIGGLAAGFACGLAMTLSRRTMVVAIGGLAIVAVAAFAAPPPRDPHRDAAARFAELETTVITRWNRLSGQLASGELSDEQCADVIDREMLPSWRLARKSFDELAIDRPRIRALMNDYLRVREEGWQIISEGLRKHDDEIQERGLAHLRRADELVKQITDNKE